MKKLAILLLVLLCVGVSAGFAQGSASDEQAIRKADADWVRAAQTKSADAWIAFYTEDAVVLPPNEPTATTKAAIRKSVAAMLSLPDLQISWAPTKVVVAKAGDLAYLYGTYKMKAKDPKSGKPFEDRGKILEIWAKQKDGKWKCAVDTWSSDLAGM